MKKYALTLSALFLIGCGTAPSISSSVTRFHDLPTAPGGKFGTYVISVPAGKDGSLQYASYAKLVKKELNSAGFVEVANPQEAENVVTFDYSIQSGGSTSYTSVNVPTPMQGNSAFARGFNSAQQTTADTTTVDLYTRKIELKIDKVKGTAPRMIYESKLVSNGSTGEINVVMPTLIRAIFTGFPGNSGETVVINLPMQK